MDCESAESREKGCWDPKTQLGSFYESWNSPTPTPDFVVDDVWRNLVASVGFGSNPSPETLSFWDETLKQVYRGDEGRKKLRIAVVNLFERDGLLLRLRDVKCPVYWLQVSGKRSERNLDCVHTLTVIRYSGHRRPCVWTDRAC